MRAVEMRFRTGPANFWRFSHLLLGCAILLVHAATAGAAISSSGDVTPDPSTTTSSQTLYIGRSAIGAMTVDDGSVVASGTSYIGYNTGGTGAATVTGSGSTWNSRNLTIGDSGSGQLIISAGGKVNSSAFGTIGDGPGSTGAVEVSGAGSEWNGSSFLTVGDQGSGTLIISDGGLVSNSIGEVGGFDGDGHATVTGAGSRWINSGTFTVGAFGRGTMTIADGGLVSSSAGSMGDGSGDSGRLTIEGSGSRWIVTNELTIGEFGVGILELYGGLAEVGRDTYVGRFSQGAGEIRFDGGTLTTGGLLAQLSDLHGTGTINTQGLVSDIDLVFDENNGLEQQIVAAEEPNQNVTINLDATAAGTMGAGYRAQGSLTITGGRSVSSRDGYLGFHSSAVGNAEVSGAGSTWALSGSLTVGNNGTGMLSITNGGAVDVAGATRLARSSNLASGIQFDIGTLTTQSLFASPNQLAGTGVINARGIVSDIDLVFDENHPFEQQFTFNSETDQNITVNLDVDGTGAMGAGYLGEGSLTIDNVAVDSSSGHVGVRPGSNGMASVTGEDGKWTISGELFIGQNGIGELTIDEGATVSSAAGRIGGGRVTVTGNGSTWTNSRGLAIGEALNATAELVIENGGTVTSASMFGAAPFGSGIGVQTLSTGKVTVTGAGSSWTHANSLTIGEDGTGMLTISNGGRVSSTGAVISASCNFCGGGSGTVTITDPGSEWIVDGTLTVSNGKPGTMTISNGGNVSSTAGAIAAVSQSNGTVNVAGNGSTWTMSGMLAIGSPGGGTGMLSVGPGGIVAVGGDTIIRGAGTLKLDGGAFTASSMQPSSGGQFQWTAGTLHVGRYNASLTNAAGVLAPGESAGQTLIAGNYTQQAAATLEIEIGGLNPMSQYDFVNVFNAVALGGHLQLSIIDDFMPGPQNIFTVLTAGGNVTGAFANIANGQRLLTADGAGSFLVHYGATSAFDPRQVVLTNFQSTILPGDFNHNGSVDAADYVVWRRNLSGNTFVDETNYQTWRTNFGRTAEQMAESTSVPEPAAIALMCSLLLVGLLTRVRFS
jgi:T5SS/PEP-CTERM-associated repeat protein